MALLALAAGPDLTTVAERSRLVRTGRYDEVERLCHDFPLRFLGKVACQPFGTTPEGRPMWSLVASADGVLDPATARARHRPVILVQGGIHAGEIDGKDAGFMVLRAMLDGSAAAGALSAVTWVFVPVFNVDGHERFGPNHRPNQRGPAEMGWRTTAQNYNLNRDYTKADAPEMQAMLRLLGRWDPVLYVDLHVTDGAEFRHDVAVLVEPAEVGPEPLRALGRQLRAHLLARLSAAGHLPLPFYPSLRVDDDPASGFEVGLAPPRFALGYWAARDRLSLLVETHSWKTYEQRVRATQRTLLAVAELATTQAVAWRAGADTLDRTARGGAPVVLRYDNGPHVTTIDFLGYAYRREPSAVSGALAVRYDAKKPEVWRVPLHDELVPALTVEAPRAGYYLPAAWTTVAERLALHGFSLRALARVETAEVEVHRATKTTFAAKSYEGRQTLTVEGAWAKETVTLPAGTWWIGVEQPGARLLVSLLEPGAPDALLAWGFFNAAYEQKEYLEAYVAEAFAAELLARDAAVRAEFTARLGDPAFAASPEARLEFFYRRHPSWDAAYGRYPVMRAAVAPTAALEAGAEGAPAP